LAGTSTLAYYEDSSITDVKSFITLGPGPDVEELVHSVGDWKGVENHHGCDQKLLDRAGIRPRELSIGLHHPLDGVTNPK
jgi:hypothetical protein